MKGKKNKIKGKLYLDGWQDNGKKILLQHIALLHFMAAPPQVQPSTKHFFLLLSSLSLFFWFL